MIGQVLGHYRILDKIGFGGMGEVYRATDDRLGRDVALKVLKPAFASDPDRLRRFEQEARASAALSHPNIVAVYDIGIHDGAPYIVSELLEGQTLRQRLLEGPLQIRLATDYAIQAAQGLMAAHEKGITHRDLKPENLFITRDGRVKILDFGIAKLSSPEIVEERSVATMTTQTKAGSVLGTAGYMSPEQLRGKPVDHRSDIFSFGTILYEMVTGKRAFSGESEVDTMMAVLQEDPPDMVLPRPVPVAFEKIVRHCLEKEPENRFQSARDLVFALGNIPSSATSKQLIALRAGRVRFRKWLPWIITAALIAVAGILVGANLKGTPPPAYQRITFERGTIYSARFSPDGRGILYGASWNGRPLDLFSTAGESPVGRALGLTDAHLLSVSSGNELALSLHGMPDRRDFYGGVLARAPLAGGTPREISENVRSADWGPNGELAVVHDSTKGDLRYRLEYPIGKVLYETTGWISNIRFSPKGNAIAFMNHPAAWDDRGSVCVVDLAGNVTTLATGWQSEDGLAWSAQGNEVWFTAAEKGVSNRGLWAVTLSGSKRKILSVPGGLTLQDIYPDGRVLLTVDTDRLAMEWTNSRSDATRDLSWYDWTLAKDFSPDGQSVLFEEGSAPAGPQYAVAVRKIDGSPPTRLGDGSVGGFSPDGRWALAIFTGTPQHISLLPVGPGEAREIAVPQLEHIENGSAHFLPDGKHITVNGNQPGQASRTFLMDLSGSAPKPVTPEGAFATMPSPDGKYLAGSDTDRHMTLFPVSGGRVVRLPATDPPYGLVGWSSDSKYVYVYREGEVPLPVYRLDIATGRMEMIQQLTPADRAGVVSISPVVSTHDASEFVYSYYQTLSVLYVVTGLS